MIRTQIQLPDDLYHRAKQVAKQREISLAEMTRRGLELFLARVMPATVSSTDWKMPAVNGGGIRVPLDRLHEVSSEDEAAAGARPGVRRGSRHGRPGQR